MAFVSFLSYFGLILQMMDRVKAKEWNGQLGVPRSQRKR